MLSSFRITVVVLITHNLSFFVLAVQQMFLLRGKQGLLEVRVLAQSSQLRLMFELDRVVTKRQRLGDQRNCLIAFVQQLVSVAGHV